MKISEIDKAKSDLRRRKLVFGRTDSEQIMLLIASHDTQLANINRVLDLLKDIRDIAKLNEHWSISRIEELSDQTYKELRETYPKEEK